MISDHNNMKLKINYKKKDGKTTNVWNLNNMLLNWVKEEIFKRNQNMHSQE